MSTSAFQEHTSPLNVNPTLITTPLQSSPDLLHRPRYKSPLGALTPTFPRTNEYGASNTAERCTQYTTTQPVGHTEEHRIRIQAATQPLGHTEEHRIRIQAGCQERGAQRTTHHCRCHRRRHHHRRPVQPDAGTAWAWPAWLFPYS